MSTVLTPLISELAAVQSFPAILLAIQLAATNRVSKFKNSSKYTQGFKVSFEKFTFEVKCLMFVEKVFQRTSDFEISGLAISETLVASTSLLFLTV